MLSNALAPPQLQFQKRARALTNVIFAMRGRKT